MATRDAGGHAGCGRVVHLIGCRFVQYGTFEDNLVALASACSERGSRVTYVYPERPSDERFIAAVRAAGGDVEVAPGTDRGDVRGAVQIVRVVRRLRPQALHAHFGRPAYLAVVAGRALRVPTVFLTKHHESWPDLTRRHASALRVVSGLADKLVCVSEVVRAESLAAGVPSRKLAVLPFGVDAERYAPSVPSRLRVRAELGLGPGARLVLCVSHLRYPKGMDVLLEAWAEVAQRFPSAVLALAGDGPLRKELERAAASRPGGDRVRFLGVRGDVPRLLAACDVFVCPSLSEGGGLNVIEALCSGAPVLSTRVGLMKDGVADGAYLQVERRGEARAVADGLITLLGDARLAARLATRARSIVPAAFAIGTSAAAVADLYVGGSDRALSEAIA